MTRTASIAQQAAELFLAAPLPEPSAADVGAVPQALDGCSDTCAAYESDDVHYVRRPRVTWSWLRETWQQAWRRVHRATRR